MKRSFFNTTLLMIFSLCAIHAFSQYNPLTNSFTKMSGDEPVSPTQIDNLISYASLSGVPCTDSSFWAIAPTGIDQFTLVGTVITKAGTMVISGSFDPNLAFCNNLDGGLFSPTFYSTQNYNQPVYYNGTGVTTTSAISPNKLLNCGGNGIHLYYILYDASFVAKGIVRYNGSGITPIYNLRASLTITVADLAVDIYGNVWFFTGPNNSTFQSDTLNVITPGGQLLKQYSFPYNTFNGYGCFLLNNILYVGLGSSNTGHPNTLLPITITSGSATAGIPIPMPVTTVYSDMASCTPGSPLFVNEHHPLQGVIVYPNPVSDRLMISNNTNESLEIILYDITARELLHQYFTNSATVNTEQLSKGIYLYKIMNNTGGEKTGKIVKE
jgi:Secretion system C-terminal sorting domain